QDQAHDQTRFHFVMTGKKDDRSEWLASDARFVRTRLAELVGNLGYELKILKATVKYQFEELRDSLEEKNPMPICQICAHPYNGE
ncbi:unnamed protein product, partial [Sphagnum jensenii]